MVVNLPRSTPDTQGIASSAVLAFVEALDNQVDEIHGFMLLRHGHVIAEGCLSPYQLSHQHMLFSLSKSVTSIAVGFAVDEKLLAIDDPVLSFFPDDAPDEPHENLEAMTVRHLLSMTGGHDMDTLQIMAERDDGNWIRAFLSIPVVHKPGTHFLYNTGATYMLSAIVQKKSGIKLIDYLEPRLFEPLAIDDATWEESPQGINLGGIGLRAKIQDIAHFGQFLLQKGMWQGKQLLSSTWIEEATKSQIANGDYADSDWTQGYGYQFWRCRHNAYRGDGVFGQYCVVMPEQDAVLAITGGTNDMEKALDLLWENLLPAMEANAIAEDVEAYQYLTNKLSSLALAPIEGDTKSSVASQVSGQMYEIEANEWGIETISFDFADSYCALTVKMPSGLETFACGYGNWEKGKTTLFKERWVLSDAPESIFVSGAWIVQDVFSMRIRYYETPFFYNFNFYFQGDDLLIEKQVNVSFDSLASVLLTATAIS